MSEQYIRNHFDDICTHANVIEERLEDYSYLNADALIKDNIQNVKMCKKYELPYCYIDNNYNLTLLICKRKLLVYKYMLFSLSFSF